MQETKEKISSRMIKNASRLWGFQDTQSETSFDPVVGLIIGALANELAKVSTDIHSIEARILEKLVELLTPEPVTGPFPSHAIFRANPVEASVTINPNYQFYFDKRFLVPGGHTSDEKPVYFTPAGEYKLLNGQIKYLVTSAKIYQYQVELSKEIMALAKTQKSGQTSEIWFGIMLSEEQEYLDGLSLCFELRNEMYEQSFYESLSKGKWRINSKTVKFDQGLPDNHKQADSLESLLLKELDITTKVRNHINRYYHNHFFRCTEQKFKIEENRDGLPEEFFELYSSSDLNMIDDGLIWIKVNFPQIVPNDIFDDLFCSMNCFPVLNRHLNEFTQSSREFINIIPLLSDEIFLDMKKISSSNGKLFTHKSFSGLNNLHSGSYIVRHGGVGRFDSRNAAEVINYLLELLRDESAAFSIIGAEMISSDLKELNQIITRLEQRLKESNVVKKDTPYLLLQAHPEDDTLFVEFWTTNGEFANKIKSGENIHIYEGTGLWPDSVFSVTPSVGGREGMDTEERVNAYRKALLSHGRVVTKEDIKALCFEHFGKRLKSVEVKKGVKTGESTDIGFMKTIDIHLSLLKSTGDIDKDEIKHLIKDLLIKLQEQSSNVLPFRCFIQ